MLHTMSFASQFMSLFDCVIHVDLVCFHRVGFSETTAYSHLYRDLLHQNMMLVNAIRWVFDSFLRNVPIIL